jgi:CRISPR/Cas system CSM-associated protein Csm2 small subunit
LENKIMQPGKFHHRTLLAGTVVIFFFLATTSAAQTTVRGRVVGVSPDGTALLVRVPLSEGQTVERTLYVDDLTRIRDRGRSIPFEGLPAGGTATVTYARVDGRYVALFVELSGADDAVSLGGKIVSLGDRQRYEESVASTLAVVEEEIQELEHDAGTKGVDALARINVLSSRLRALLSNVRDRLDSLRGTEGSWNDARLELGTAMAELSNVLARARSEITGR